jgi:hypothetical protein
MHLSNPFPPRAERMGPRFVSGIGVGGEPFGAERGAGWV